MDRLVVLTPKGTPRTNGEVFALIRRRRDERSAKELPPFSSVPASVLNAAPVGSSSYHSYHNKNNNKNNTHQNNGQNQSSSSAFAPTSPALTVLLTEVFALRYLVKGAHLFTPPPPPAKVEEAVEQDSGKATSSSGGGPGGRQEGEQTEAAGARSAAAPACSVTALYGPSSMYDPEALHHHLYPYTKNEEESRTAAAARDSALSLSPEEGTFLRQVRALYAAAFSPDAHHTRGPTSIKADHDDKETSVRLRAGGDGCHARAVLSLLDVYEAHGRGLELTRAEKLRRLVQQVTAQYYPFLSLSSLAAAASPTPSPSLLLSDADIFQIVNARPQRPIDAFRLVDRFTERWEEWVRPATANTATAAEISTADEFIDAVIRIFQC